MNKTNVTIISTNLSRGLLANYPDYEVIDKSFSFEELLTKKKIIFFNILSSLDIDNLNKLCKLLKDNNILFINITNNIEEALFTEYLVVYDKDKIIIEGKTIEVLQNDKLLKRVGFNLPFIVNLSILLKDYNLINKIYLDKESLVGDLWN